MGPQSPTQRLQILLHQHRNPPFSLSLSLSFESPSLFSRPLIWLPFASVSWQASEWVELGAKLLGLPSGVNEPHFCTTNFALLFRRPKETVWQRKNERAPMIKEEKGATHELKSCIVWARMWPGQWGSRGWQQISLDAPIEGRQAKQGANSKSESNANANANANAQPSLTVHLRPPFLTLPLLSSCLISPADKYKFDHVLGEPK